MHRNGNGSGMWKEIDRGKRGTEDFLEGDIRVGAIEGRGGMEGVGE